MSKEEIKRLVESSAKDKRLKSKFDELNKKISDFMISEEQKESIMKNEIIPLAIKEGFEFTYEEYKVYIAETDPDYGELSDETLDKFTGGKGDDSKSSGVYDYPNCPRYNAIDSTKEKHCSNCKHFEVSLGKCHWD